MISQIPATAQQLASLQMQVAPAAALPPQLVPMQVAPPVPAPGQPVYAVTYAQPQSTAQLVQASPQPTAQLVQVPPPMAAQPSVIIADYQAKVQALLSS